MKCRNPETGHEKPCATCDVGWRIATQTGVDQRSDTCERLKEWQEANMEKTDKPRICEVLGGKERPLEVGEKFRVTNHAGVYWIDGTGEIKNSLVNGNIKQSDIIADILLDCPIIRWPRFTEEEIADFLSYRIERDDEFLYFTKGKHVAIPLPIDTFPSLLPGQSVALREILKAGKADDTDHKGPAGKRGPWGMCPGCGAIGQSDWDSDADVCSCRVCGYTNRSEEATP